MFGVEYAASQWRTDIFEVWNSSTEAFDSEITGRLMRLDRFKSIYTRPVHRRQATLDADIPIPDSLTLRHKTTGNIYIVGNIRREDSLDNEVYDGVITLHLASSDSGGYCDLHRHAVQGTGDNLGALVDSTQSSFYLDLELRTASADPEAHDTFVGNYFVTTPANSNLQTGDYLHLGTDQYRVDEVYFDSGYLQARVAKEDFDKEVITYHLETGTGGGYDTAAGVVTPETVSDRQVSATVAMATETDMENSVLIGEDLLLYIDFDHVGFTPKVEHDFTYNSRKYKVVSVSIASNKYQWKLVSRRA